MKLTVTNRTRPGLSKQQIEILGLIGDGCTVKAIALANRLSPKTVEWHKAKIMRILNLRSNAELVKMAIGFGLTTLCLLLCALPASAAAQTFLVVSNPAPSVQLGWNPVPSVSVYRLYYGVGSRQYTNMTSVGNVTNSSLTLPARGVAFFFAVTAVDSNGLESQFSNEITYTAPSPPAAPAMKPLVVLTVQTSPTPTGTFADSEMFWSLSPDTPQQYYKLRETRGVMLTVATPPLPSK